MSHPTPAGSRPPHDELPEPYRLAVQTILDEPVPNVDLTRLVPEALPMPATRPTPRRRITRTRAWYAAGAAAVVIVFSTFMLWPTDAWSQVIGQVRKQAWVRLTASDPKGEAKVQIWMSPGKGIGAGQFPGAAVFVEFGRNVQQQFDQKSGTIIVSEPGSFDQDEFAAFDAILQSFGGKEGTPKANTGSTKLIAKSREEKQDGDLRWTEFVFDLEDARRSPPMFRQIFRVPHGKQLPAAMTEEWTFQGKKSSRTYEIDYPETGPADLFVLGAPKDAKVIDIRSGKELKALLDEYAWQQRMPFDPYTATVLGTVQQWRFVHEARHVRLEGAVHTTEVVDAEQLLKFNSQVWENKTEIPEGEKGIEWWKTEVNKMAFREYGNREMYSPGQTFVPELVVYPLLGLPNEGIRATLNPKPSVGPADCVLVSVEEARSGKILRRYWFSPERGMICVRSETTPEKPNDWISTTIVDKAEKSPKGRWYATQARIGQVERSGDDLHAETGVSPVATTVFRYLVEFQK
ncbi:hypothetical protein [Zavarzinella formosa]|uniref:hypothetical protein n=1 Tax=Zavarzinella formosa TaxID=360055 RepID=UPI0002DB509C|nr:hypothetical protein [Zavarzinella formosa]